MRQSGSPIDHSFGPRRPSFDLASALARDWHNVFRFLFVKPEVLRRAFIPYFRFLKKDFHPWQDDDRYLIDEWEAKHQTQ